MPNPYPVSTKVRQEIGEAIDHSAIRMMVEALESYEHGNTDLVDLHPTLTVEQYGVVVVDLALAIAAQL